MTAATDTTSEPDTKSAGTKLLMLLKSVVFIIRFPIRYTTKKPLSG